MHVCGMRCIHMCVHVEARNPCPQTPYSLFLGTGSLLDLELTNRPKLARQWAPEICLSLSTQRRDCKCAIRLSFDQCILQIKLGSSCFYRNHFSSWAIFQSFIFNWKKCIYLTETAWYFDICIYFRKAKSVILLCIYVCKMWQYNLLKIWHPSIYSCTCNIYIYIHTQTYTHIHKKFRNLTL